MATIVLLNLVLSIYCRSSTIQERPEAAGEDNLAGQLNAHLVLEEKVRLIGKEPANGSRKRRHKRSTEAVLCSAKEQALRAKLLQNIKPIKALTLRSIEYALRRKIVWILLIVSAGIFYSLGSY